MATAFADTDSFTATTDAPARIPAPADRPANTVECLCPFCGAFNAGVGRPCGTCGTEDTTAARAAARKRVGPWFVLNTRNPAAPGMGLPALLAMVRQGTVTDRSVVRGPATGQLWRLAGKVRGLSREFGLCYGCGGELTAGAGLCPHCQRPQSLPADIDADPAPAGFVAADRRPPRDDLLTPRDVAKAFSLGYGPGSASTPPVSLDALLPRSVGPQLMDRPQPRVVAAVVAGVIALTACGWLISRVATASHRTATPALASAVKPATVVTVPPVTVPPVTVPAVAAVSLPVVPVAPPVAPSVARAFVPEPMSRSTMIVHRPPVVAVDDTAVPAAATLNEPSATVAADEDDPKQLMATGLAAEARGDYAVAVKQYERLESLSNSQWPADLKDRLKLARRAARGDVD